MNAPISRYDFVKQFRKHGTMAVIARRGSGKSVFLIDVLYHLRSRFDLGIAFTTTTPTAEKLAQFMPRACIFTEFSVDKIANILNEQELLVAKGKSRSIFLLLDDCGFDAKSMNSKPMKELFFNGRHKKITFLCALQSAHTLRPDMRQQLDLVVALKENVIPNRRRIFDAFFGTLSWHDFEKLFTAFTQEYGALLVDQTVQSSNVSDVIYYYRAELNPPPFICVSKAYVKIWQALKKSEREVYRLREQKIEEERRRRIAIAAKESGMTPIHVAVRADHRPIGNEKDGVQQGSAMIVKSMY